MARGQGKQLEFPRYLSTKLPAHLNPTKSTAVDVTSGPSYQEHLDLLMTDVAGSSSAGAKRWLSEEHGRVS